MGITALLNWTLAIAALNSNVHLGQQPQLEIIVTEASGVRRGSLSPRPDPPLSPPAGLSDMSTSTFFSRHDVKDEKGRILTGLGFRAWMEGKLVRVAIFTLVPKPGTPNVYLARNQNQTGSILPVPFVDLSLSLGVQRKLVEMARLGLEPYVLTLSIRRPRNRDSRDNRTMILF
jgi:hypothetical protein